MASLKRYLRERRRRKIGPVRYGVTPLPPNSLPSADAIVTTNEVTDRHGTGVILGRIFGEAANILSIRSTDLYHHHCLGVQTLCLPHKNLSRAQSFERVIYALNGNAVQRVLCVPFLPDELITAIALKELFRAPLCLYVMDDNNVYAHGIPDELMREAVNKADLRLAISPEMRDVYESKYNQKFWVVPPIVSAQCVRTHPETRPKPDPESRVGVLIGNVWSRRWLERLRQTVREAGIELHWYGNATAPWLKVTATELHQDGIIDCGFLPEAELSDRLGQYPYAVIPSGCLDEEDDRPEIARLSLPTRMPYLLAAGNIPMLVLGSPDTAAAGFVRRFGVGFSVPYEAASLRRAVAEICQPEMQWAFRDEAATHSPTFSGAGLAEWIWKALETGEPGDDRFEHKFARPKRTIVPFLDPPAPKDLWGDFVPVYQALRRLKTKGFAPDFLIDVGASSGVWSDVAHRVFPQSRFILVDPLYQQYADLNDWYFKKHPEFEFVQAALADHAGEAELRVSDNLYSSSFLYSGDTSHYQPLKVPVRTLDEVAAEKKLTGRGLLKIDVQFTEHLVLAGARRLLPQIDALLVELSLVRYDPKALIFPEMYQMIQDLGFRYFEDVGGWRSPIDGTPLQKDVLFVRSDLFLPDIGPDPEEEAEPESTSPCSLPAEAIAPA